MKNCPINLNWYLKKNFIETNKEDCEDTIKRGQGFISDNKENIKRMKEQDRETHKLFDSLKVFDKKDSNT